MDAAGLLITTSLTVSDNGSALRGPGAFLPDLATAIGCSAAGCPLPPIAAHSAIIATVTLKLTSPDLTKISGLTISIKIDGSLLVSLKLPDLLPTFTASTRPLVAGETGDFDVTARFTDLTGPVDPGDLTIQRDNGQVIMAGDTSCTTVTEVRCPPQPAGTNAFVYHFRATALPAAVDQPQQFPVALTGTPGTVSAPGVTVRSPGRAIDMTGQFEGMILGEATTRCVLKSGRCRYESGVDAGLRTFTVAGRKVLWAELTWIAPAGQRADGELGSTTRDLVLASPTQPQDRQLESVTGQVIHSENGFIAISADVTDTINAALTLRTTSAVSMPFDNSVVPANRPPTSDTPTGWTLSVIWATGAGPPHQIQTFGPTFDPDLVAEKKAQFHILVAPAGAPVGRAGALLLGTTAPHSTRDRNMSRGAFCILGRCQPQGWSDLTTYVDGAHDQSVIFRLTKAQSDDRRAIVVGPGLVQRSVQESLPRPLDVPISPARRLIGPPNARP